MKGWLISVAVFFFGIAALDGFADETLSSSRSVVDSLAFAPGPDGLGAGGPGASGFFALLHARRIDAAEAEGNRLLDRLESVATPSAARLRGEISAALLESYVEVEPLPSEKIATIKKRLETSPPGDLPENAAVYDRVRAVLSLLEAERSFREAELLTDLFQKSATFDRALGELADARAWLEGEAGDGDSLADRIRSRSAEMELVRSENRLISDDLTVERFLREAVVFRENLTLASREKRLGVARSLLDAAKTGGEELRRNRALLAAEIFAVETPEEGEGESLCRFRAAAEYLAGNRQTAVDLLGGLLTANPRDKESLTLLAGILSQETDRSALTKAVELWTLVASNEAEGSEPWFRAKEEQIRLAIRLGRRDEAERLVKILELGWPNFARSEQNRRIQKLLIEPIKKEIIP